MEKFNLNIPDHQPRGVFEHFILGDIEITNHKLPISKCNLDEKGISRFNYYASISQLETVCGIAKLKWKSYVDRINCIELQKSKNKNRPFGESRWTEILLMINTLKREEVLPLPALVCTDLHKNDGLLIIDGARRIIANIEALKESFNVLIIKPKSPFTAK